MAREVSGPGVFWVSQHDVSQVPFVSQMPVPDRYTDGEDLSDGFGVDDEVVRVRVAGCVSSSRQSKQIGVIFFFFQTSV